MKTIIARSTLVLPFLLAACGGTAGGGGEAVANKDQAAQATYRMQQTGEDLNNRQSQGLTVAQVGGLPDFSDGVNASTEYTVDGADGTAKVSLQASVTGGDVQASYIIEYSGYSSNGIDYIDGKLEYVSRVLTSGDGVSVSHQVKGQADIWGTQASSLDVDTTLTVDVSGSAGTVSVEMDGTVTADGETFVYDGETFGVQAGVF